MTRDDELDGAVESLRAVQADGPAPRLKAETVSALRRAEHRSASKLSRRTPTGIWLRLAAAVIVIACGVAIYLAVSWGRFPELVDRPPAPPGRTQPAPTVPLSRPDAPTVPATAPAPGPDRTLVENAPSHRPSATHAVAVPAAPWSITGVVRFEGEAPPRARVDMSANQECARHHAGGVADESVVVNDGRLANVVVSVRPASGQDLPRGDAPARPALLDQRGCQYHPHVLAMRVGQPIVVSNSDALLHNVHALTLDNPSFNFGQPTVDPGKNLGPMQAPEVFKVKCDFHPWMLAYVHVFEHPFFAVTKEDGSFEIPPGLPDGRYTLVAWHERLGEKKVAVNVAGGKAEGAEFTFKAQ